MKRLSFSPEALAKKRNDKQMSFSQLAFEVSKARGKVINEKTVRDWERDRCSPGADNLAALAEVFECSTDDFFSRRPLRASRKQESKRGEAAA